MMTFTPAVVVLCFGAVLKCVFSLPVTSIFMLFSMTASSYVHTNVQWGDVVPWVFNTRNFLNVQTHKSDDTLRSCLYTYTCQYKDKTGLWNTVTQGWERMSCAVYRASTLTCSIFPISSCKKTQRSWDTEAKHSFNSTSVASLDWSLWLYFDNTHTHNKVGLGHYLILESYYTTALQILLSILTT